MTLTLVFSCAEKGGTSDKEAVNLDEFRSYHLDINQPKERFSNLVESVEIVKLEETDNSLLSDVSNLKKTDDYLVFLSGGGANVYVFDLAGNLVNKVNRKGNGPEEYTGIDDMWLVGDTLSIYSKIDTKVNRYTIDGSFIDSKKLPYQVGHVLGHENGYAMDMNYELIDDSARFRYAFLDENLEVEATYLPYKTSPSFTVYKNFQTVSSYNSGVLFFRMLSDTIYFLKDQEFRPIAHLDFGKEWFWRDKGEISAKYIEELQNHDGIWDAIMYMGEKYIYVMGLESFGSTTSSPFFLINRATDETHNLDFRKQGDTFSIKAEGWDKESMIFSIQSTQIASFLSELEDSQIKFRQGTTLEEIESSENPVLMWVKFKEEY